MNHSQSNQIVPNQTQEEDGRVKTSKYMSNEDIRQSKKRRNHELHELPSNKAVRIQEEIKVETIPLRPI